MTYRDEMDPNYLKSLEEIKRKRLFCNHVYKKIMTVENEIGKVDTYVCNKCGDMQHIRRGEEYRIIGEIKDVDSSKH
jgi:mRNA-degrading endonuclease RelE of RelBE toxin-antitoxin system